MSLLLWYPMINDSSNKGILSPNQLSLNLVANGKPGKCYKITTANSTGIKMNEHWDMRNTSTSMCCWVKINRAELYAKIRTLSYSAEGSKTQACGTIIGYQSYGGMSITAQTNKVFVNEALIAEEQVTVNVYGYTRAKNASNANAIAQTGTAALPYDTWVHLAYIADKEANKMYFYMDGVLKGTSTMPSIATWPKETGEFHIGQDNVHSGNGPGTYFPFLVSDVRLYDYALTLNEIKEIKKAMLVHYNFENAFGDVEKVKSLNDWQAYIDASGGSAVGTKTPQSDGSILIESVDQNARLRWQDYIAITAGERYTVSIKYKQVSGDQTFRWQIQERSTAGGGSVYYTHWSTSGQKEEYLGDGWKLIHFSFVVKNSGYFMIWLQEGADYAAYNQKYYLKDFSVSLYTKEYDCSGHEINATVTGVDLPEVASVGKRSAYFTTTGEQYLTIPNAPLNNKEISISLWFKSNNAAAKGNYHILFATQYTSSSYSSIELSIPNNGQLRWGFVIGSTRTTNNTTTSPKMNNGEWRHIVMTYDGTTEKAYVDGTLVGSRATQGTITYPNSPSTFIGKYVNGSYGATDAYIDDIRVYSTTLTQEDVTSLYKHTTKIFPDQTMKSNLFVEEGLQEHIEFVSTPYKTGGWGGTTAIENNELVLTATNGWHSFVWLTPENLKTKNAVLSFEYCFMDKEGWSDGVWVHTTSSTAQYLIGTGPKVYNTDLGVWTSISLPLTNLTDYIGWTLRGADGKGKKIIMRIRNPHLLVDKTNVKVQPTGVVECNGLNQIAKVRLEGHGLVTATDFIEQ